MRTSAMDKEKLIALVYGRRCLWDTTFKGYHIRENSKDNWKEVADELNVTNDALQDDYSENTIDNFSQYAPQKRSCVRRGGSCDHRPSECCYNGSCRCNLWGTNCRCQRGGLFQKWG